MSTPCNREKTRNELVRTLMKDLKAGNLAHGLGKTHAQIKEEAETSTTALMDMKEMEFADELAEEAKQEALAAEEFDSLTGAVIEINNGNPTIKKKTAIEVTRVSRQGQIYYRYVTKRPKKGKAYPIEAELITLDQGYAKTIVAKYMELGKKSVLNQTNGVKGNFDKELDKKLQKILKELYPNIKLEYTEQQILHGEGGMNQEVVNNTVKFGLKVVEALNSLGTAKPSRHGGASQPVLSTIRLKNEAGLRKKLAAKDVSKEQIDFVFEYMEQNGISEIAIKQLAERVLLGLGTGVEIKNTTAISFHYNAEDNPFDIVDLDTNSAYYKDLTVPGGNNYKEKEISTPSIVAPRKGHADFATDKGIGWYRVDDDVKDGTLRVLEMQSDMFQKMKDEKLNISGVPEMITGNKIREMELQLMDKEEQWGDAFDSNLSTAATLQAEVLALSKEIEDMRLTEFNKRPKDLSKAFLQILNTDNKWVKFFIQSLVQDATKNGYKKIKFPTGETVAEVEQYSRRTPERRRVYDNNKKIQKEVDAINAEGKILYKQGNREPAAILYKKADKLEATKEQEVDAISYNVMVFYQIRVRNTLIKTYGKENVQTVKDDHGNEWFELTLDAKRDTSRIMLQKNTGNEIKGQADIEAKTVLISSLLQSQDTLPHEYAHHYINMFRDAPLVKSAIKKWGSEEALVQAIGEQVVEQKGAVWDWWKKFSKWVKSKFNGFSEMEKEEIKNVLTDAFLSKANLKAISTRKNMNQQLSELFLDTVNPRYTDNGINTSLDEFIDYTESVFPKSELKDIYKHDTNIQYSSSLPSDYEVVKALDNINKNTRQALDDVITANKEAIESAHMEYIKLKKSRVGVSREKVTFKDNIGLIAVNPPKAGTKKSILGQLAGYQTETGYIEYIDTNTLKSHTINTEKLNDYKLSHDERSKLEKEYAEKLKGSNIIIKQIVKSGMLGTDKVYYVADKDNDLIKVREKIAQNLFDNGLEAESSDATFSISGRMLLPALDSIILTKGVEEITSQKDIIEYMFKELPKNPMFYTFLAELWDVKGARELFNTLETGFKPLLSTIKRDVRKVTAENSKWMYKEGFSEVTKGNNINVNELGYYFGELGQTQWGNGNTTFLTKLNVGGDKKGRVSSISSLTEEFLDKNDQYPKEAVVYDTNQIHIFGSDKDIGMFKEWKVTQTATGKDTTQGTPETTEVTNGVNPTQDYDRANKDLTEAPTVDKVYGSQKEDFKIEQEINAQAAKIEKDDKILATILNTAEIKRTVEFINDNGAHKASSEEMQDLQDIIDMMQDEFFNEVVTVQGKSKKTAKTSGHYVANNDGTGIIKMHLSKKKLSLAAGKERPSDAAVYLHEVIHAMTVHGYALNTPEASTTKSHLNYVIDKFMENKTYRDILPKDVKITQAMDEEAREKFEYLTSSPEEFIAHGLTDKNVIRELKTLAIQDKDEPKTLFESVKKFFSEMLSLLLGNYKYVDRGNNGHEQLIAIAKELGEINNVTINELPGHQNVLRKIWDGIMDVDTAISDKVEEFWDARNKNAHYEKIPKDGIARAIWVLKASYKLIYNKEYRTSMRLMLSAYGLDPRGDIQSIIRDFQTPDENDNAVDDLLLRAGKIDQAKNTLKAVAGDMVRSGFKKELSDEEKAAITTVLIDTDIQGMFGKNGMYPRKFKELLINEEKLRRAIKESNNKLRKLAPDRYNWLSKQAVGLGYYMATGKGHEAQLLNSYNITSGVGTSKKVGLTDKNAWAVRQEVDTLASLVALKHTPIEDRKLVRALFTTESKGLLNVMKMHSDFAKEAKEKAFNGKDATMIKGYSKELFDGEVGIRIAPEKSRKELEDAGYTYVKALKKHSSDVTKEPMAMYKSNSFDVSDYLRAATIMTGSQAKGTSLAEIYAKNAGDSYSTFEADKVVARMEIASIKLNREMETNKDFNPMEVANNSMILPQVDQYGSVIGFRYVMEKAAKEELLKQDKNIINVMGSSFAHTLDKDEGTEHNRRVLSLIQKDMNENYIHGSRVGKNNVEYIVIKKNAQDKEAKELYKLLPPVFKIAIDNNANEEIAVRADHFHSYFGYRHMSLGNNKLLKAITPKMVQEWVKIAEAMWIEVIKLTKVDLLIKLPFVIIGNIISNIIYGIQSGTFNPFEVVGLYTASLRDITQYEKDEVELIKLRIAKRTGNVQNLDLRKIVVLEKRMIDNPVNELAEWGVKTALSEDRVEEREQSTNKIKAKIDKKFKNAPKALKTALQWLYLTEDTAYYKFMNTVLTRSDLIARDVMNRKLKIIQEKQANGKLPIPKWWDEKDKHLLKSYKYVKRNRVLEGKERAEFMKEATQRRKHIILNAVVFYDKPPGKKEDYLNRTGFIMFTTYGKKIQRVIKDTVSKNPTKVAGLVFAQYMLGDADDIMDQALWDKSWYTVGMGPGDYIPGMDMVGHLMNVVTPPLVQLAGHVIQ